MNLAIALTATRYGAAVANYTEVVHLLKKNDPQTGKERVCGARCRDVITGEATRSLLRGLKGNIFTVSFNAVAVCPPSFPRHRTGI